MRTVVVRPDGTIVSSTAAPATATATESTTPIPPSTSVAASETTANTRPVPAPVVADVRPPQPAHPAPAVDEDTASIDDDFESSVASAPDEKPAVVKPAVRGTQAATASTAVEDAGPISLLPKSGSAEKPAEKPVERKVAAVAPDAQVEPEAPTAAASGNYYVQISSQRSESAATDSYREAQRRFPSVLRDRDPDIRRADLGTKGIYFRARVGPGMSSAEANKLCASLKSAGGDCIVTAN